MVKLKIRNTLIVSRRKEKRGFMEGELLVLEIGAQYRAVQDTVEKKSGNKIDQVLVQ